MQGAAGAVHIEVVQRAEGKGELVPGVLADVHEPLVRKHSDHMVRAHDMRSQAGFVEAKAGDLVQRRHSRFVIHSVPVVRYVSSGPWQARPYTFRMSSSIVRAEVA